MNGSFLSAIVDNLSLKTTVKNLQENIEIIDVNRTNLIKIKVGYSNVDLAFKILDSITNLIITKGQNMFKERLNAFNERLSDLDLEINKLEIDINREQALNSKLSDSKDTKKANFKLNAVLSKDSLVYKKRNLNILKGEEKELRFIIDNATSFKVFDQLNRSNYLVIPNIKKNVFIVGIMSLIFSMLLVLYIEGL